ncbi:hypothetical protein Gotur_019025, partial [Gossypium turneri]
MEALKDDSVSVIGVHGMGGIGKTMLVKEIVSKVKGKLFDSVVIATVTQAIDVEKIQNQIADLLGLKLEEQSMVGKALRLRERLKKEVRILVVLDDIWAKIDIEEEAWDLFKKKAGDCVECCDLKPIAKETFIKQLHGDNCGIFSYRVDLLRYTVGLGLFGGVNTMEEARNKVLTVVAYLKASSLLLDSYEDERFDIHDVVCDAALAI